MEEGRKRVGRNGDVVDLRLQSEAGEKLNGETIVWAAGGGNVTEDRFATRW